MTDLPCINLFERLAKENPAKLIDMLGTLKPADLTFAAEIVGQLLSSDVAVPALMQLLDHQSSLVREGAVYGLSYHMDAPGVAEKLNKMAHSDPSPAIRSSITIG